MPHLPAKGMGERGDLYLTPNSHQVCSLWISFYIDICSLPCPIYVCYNVVPIHRLNQEGGHTVDQSGQFNPCNSPYYMEITILCLWLWSLVKVDLKKFMLRRIYSLMYICVLYLYRVIEKSWKGHHIAIHVKNTKLYFILFIQGRVYDPGMFYSDLYNRF